MKKRKIVVIVAGVLIILIPAIVFGINRLNEHLEYQRSRELILGMERREREAYVRLNYAFLLGNATANTDDLDLWNEHNVNRFASYSRLEDRGGFNDFGIHHAVYLALRMYEAETGNILSWETVLDYHSQEFEPDGSRRLYKNGKHPEIEAFMKWMVEGARGGGYSHMAATWVFTRELEQMYFAYARTHEEFESCYWGLVNLSPQMLDALVRAYADLDYVLDLTSLQQSGY